MDEWMNGQMDGRMDRWMDGQMDGQMDKWMGIWMSDGWTDGRMDGKELWKIPELPQPRNCVPTSRGAGLEVTS